MSGETPEEQEILNIIADIQEANAQLDIDKQRVIELEDQLEGANDDVQSTLSSIENLKTELREKINEITAIRAERGLDYTY